MPKSPRKKALVEYTRLFTEPTSNLDKFEEFEALVKAAKKAGGAVKKAKDWRNDQKEKGRIKKDVKGDKKRGSTLGRMKRAFTGKSVFDDMDAKEIAKYAIRKKDGSEKQAAGYLKQQLSKHTDNPELNKKLKQAHQTVAKIATSGKEGEYAKQIKKHKKIVKPGLKGHEDADEGLKDDTPDEFTKAFDDFDPDLYRRDEEDFTKQLDLNKKKLEYIVSRADQISKDSPAYKELEREVANLEREVGEMFDSKDKREEQRKKAEVGIGLTGDVVDETKKAKEISDLDAEFGVDDSSGSSSEELSNAHVTATEALNALPEDASDDEVKAAIEVQTKAKLALQKRDLWDDETDAPKPTGVSTRDEDPGEELPTQDFKDEADSEFEPEDTSVGGSDDTEEPEKTSFSGLSDENLAVEKDSVNSRLEALVSKGEFSDEQMDELMMQYAAVRQEEKGRGVGEEDVKATEPDESKPEPELADKAADLASKLGGEEAETDEPEETDKPDEPTDADDDFDDETEDDVEVGGIEARDKEEKTYKFPIAAKLLGVNWEINTETPIDPDSLSKEDKAQLKKYGKEMKAAEKTKKDGDVWAARTGVDKIGDDGTLYGAKFNNVIQYFSNEDNAKAYVKGVEEKGLNRNKALKSVNKDRAAKDAAAKLHKNKMNSNPQYKNKFKALQKANPNATEDTLLKLFQDEDDKESESAGKAVENNMKFAASFKRSILAQPLY